MHLDRSLISYIGGYFLAISNGHMERIWSFRSFAACDRWPFHLHKLVVMPHPRDSRSMLGIHHQMPNGMIYMTTGTAHILELHLSVSLVVAWLACKMVRPCHNTISERCVCFIHQLPAHYMTIDMSIGMHHHPLQTAVDDAPQTQYYGYETCSSVYIFPGASNGLPYIGVRFSQVQSISTTQSDPLLPRISQGSHSPHQGSPRDSACLLGCHLKSRPGDRKPFPGLSQIVFSAKILGVCIPGITQGTYNMDSCRMIKLITKKRSSPTWENVEDV